MSDIRKELEELTSAEEFLEFFAIPYEDEVVRVNRLHILQRFHDYLARMPPPTDSPEVYSYYAALLQRAYDDFVHSDARSQKVFKVFHRNERQIAFVPLTKLARGTL